MTSPDPAAVPSSPAPVSSLTRVTNPMTDKVLARCPECGTELRKASGCLTCLACGWGKCG